MLKFSLMSFAGLMMAGFAPALAASAAPAATPLIAAMDKEAGGLQHVGIPTRNMAATAEFYTKLGFKQVAAYQNGKSAVRFFEYKGLMLEVWESDEATGKAGAINHIALDTKSADALYPVIKAAGFKMINDKVMFLPFWQHGIKYFNIQGPNGEIIEFCEKVKK